MKTKKAPAFDDVVQDALKLSTVDKVRLIERLASVLQYDVGLQPAAPKESLYGALAKYGPAPSDEEIAEARRELWSSEPVGSDR